MSRKDNKEGMNVCSGRKNGMKWVIRLVWGWDRGVREFGLDSSLNYRVLPVVGMWLWPASTHSWTRWPSSLPPTDNDTSVCTVCSRSCINSVEGRKDTCKEKRGRIKEKTLKQMVSYSVHASAARRVVKINIANRKGRKNLWSKVTETWVITVTWWFFSSHGYHTNRLFHRNLQIRHFGKGEWPCVDCCVTIANLFSKNDVFSTTNLVKNDIRM